jgi:hypothetical protein
MQLKSIVLENIAVGDVLVGRMRWAAKPETLRLVIVQEMRDDDLILAPFAATFGDDEDDDLSSGEVRIAKTRVRDVLAIARLEVGDALLHRERAAVIIETKEHDWHVKIRYSDALGGEFYGNLIWMDLSPTLSALDLAQLWPK